MIIDGFINILSIIISALLSPLEIINISIDYLSSLTVVSSFIQVIAYLLPWDNLLPLIVLVIAILLFKLVISLITAIWDLLPFL